MSHPSDTGRDPAKHTANALLDQLTGAGAARPIDLPVDYLRRKVMPRLNAAVRRRMRASAGGQG